MRTKILAKKVSVSFYDSVCSKVEMLSDGTKSLSDLTKYLVEALKYHNTSLEFFTLRAIIDVHVN